MDWQNGAYSAWKQNNFLGIIKYVKFIQKEDHVGNQIEISGYSKTDLLNSGKKRYSWENCTLKEIVESVLRNGVGKFRELKNQINPEYKHEIKYQTQYNETDFEFLQRLAKQYNEWFYYDCEQLIFGKPEKFDAMINLLFESDLSHLKIALQSTTQTFGLYLWWKFRYFIQSRNQRRNRRTYEVGQARF